MSEGLAGDVLTAGKKVVRENIAPRSGQESLVVVIEDSVALASEVAAVPVSVKVRSVQATGNDRGQQSTGGRDSY